MKAQLQYFLDNHLTETQKSFVQNNLAKPFLLILDISC